MAQTNSRGGRIAHLLRIWKGWDGKTASTGTAPTLARLYPREFFSEFARRSLQSARVVLPEVFRHISPQSAVDVGCGIGCWLRVASDIGVQRVLGIDGDHVDDATLIIRREDFMSCSLETEFATTVFDKGHQLFDVALCLEVAEHLPRRSAPMFVEQLTRLSDVVLFSAAVPFQGGVHHVNEQWPEYWALLFRQQGYGCCDIVRPLVWTNPCVEWWYAQNLLLFIRHGSWAADNLPVDSQPRPLAVVHPCNYLCRASASGVQRFPELRALWQQWYDWLPPGAQGCSHRRSRRIACRVGE